MLKVKMLGMAAIVGVFLWSNSLTVAAADDKIFDNREFVYNNSETCFDSDNLWTASYIYVNKLSNNGLQKVLRNNNLKELKIKDISNLNLSVLSEENISKLYDYLCKDNIEYSAILLAYENVKDSVGNDGTDAYKHAVDTYAADASDYYRSCATAVSAILNASGYVEDYSSAGVSGLVNYFNTNPDEWEDLGKLKSSQMQEGDVVFIDRQSHKEDYIKGLMSDPDFDLEVLVSNLETIDSESANQIKDETLDLGSDEEGYYDESGNYIVYDLQDFGYYDPDGNWCGYETSEGYFGEDKQIHPFTDDRAKKGLEAPKGGYNKVFNPDQNGDGTIDETEAGAWSDYWTGLGEEVPDYSYYDTWKSEAEEYKTKLNTALNSLDENTLKALNGKQIKIHNHIIVWLGNDVIKKYYPNSTGNIVSASYSDTYTKARSAAVSSFNFKGDYHVYRHK